jgi:tripartite-type tricarboxylate transporter receptor subunit TctC
MMRVLPLIAAVLVGSIIGLSPAAAQTYPAKVVRVILPYPPGGPSDPLVRAIAQKMSEGLGAPFVVDNRAGANGIIGTEIAVKSPPDGYTLVFGSTSSLPMNAAIYPKLSFDPVRDLVPISTFAHTSQILVVHPSLPTVTVKDFIALARSRPGQIVYGSGGIGTSAHFAAEMFSAMTGIRMLHVPYKGGGPVTVDLLAGRVMMYFDSTQNAMPNIRAQRLRPLGIAALKRSPAAPDVPTISEAGVPGFEVGTVFGLLAPRNTPRDIVTKLNTEMIRVLALPDVRQLMTSVGTEPIGSTPEEFADMIRKDVVKWTKVAREANIRAE